MEKALRDGTALLLLDAIDEAMVVTVNSEADASYKHVSEAIQNVATRYHQAPIVVTARKAGYYQHARLTGFNELEVLDFRQQDIEQFIRQWFDSSPRTRTHASAGDLIAKLSRNTRLQTLAANPLLLSLIVIVYEDQLELPEQRAELYRRCVEILLTKWDASRDIVRKRIFKPDKKLMLLKEIAWHFHRRGQRYVPESELLNVIRDYLPKIGIAEDEDIAILEEIAAENGLLKEQARLWYGFLHLTLQEYFVALYMTDNGQLDELLKHIGDPWWEEVFLLYAGQVQDASALLETLLGENTHNPLPDDIFHTNLILAGRCLAVHPRSISNTSLRKTITNRLFDVLEHTIHSLTAEQVAKALIEVDEKSINSRLLHMLSDKQLDLSVRGGIATILGTLGNPSVTADMLLLLKKENFDTFVRGRIAIALRNSVDRSIVPDLLHMLSDEQLDSTIRVSIADTLAAVGDRSIVPDLLHMLSDEQLDSSVRRVIAFSLVILEDRSIVPDLLHLLKEENLRNVRGSIVSALATVGDQSIVPDLLHMLSDEQFDPSLRVNIARALGRLGDRSVVPDLLHMLSEKQQNINVRGGIASALGELGDRSIVPDLLRLLGEENINPFIYGCIANALGELEDRSIVPDLLHLLKEEHLNSFVRRCIASALETLGDDANIIYTLALLPKSSDVAETTFVTLWNMCQRMKVRVYITNEQTGSHIEIVPIEDVLK